MTDGLAGGVCWACGCSDYDCSGCVERTGQACSWVSPGLCSACAGSDADRLYRIAREIRTQDPEAILPAEWFAPEISSLAIREAEAMLEEIYLRGLSSVGPSLILAAASALLSTPFGKQGGEPLIYRRALARRFLDLANHARTKGMGA